MKRFIKTADGWYIDQSKIDAFTVAKYFDTDGKGAGYAVRAYRDGQRLRLKECETEAEAQAWLDKLVSEINGD
ncbi:MAG: hypothetical protein IJQ01_08885 [Selenomonadaceae bacterium]|nr:hypothetical protein [Selenomonadaceae bacterium]